MDDWLVGYEEIKYVQAEVREGTVAVVGGLGLVGHRPASIPSSPLRRENPAICRAFAYSGTGTRTPISRTRTGRHCQLDYPGQRFEAKNSQSGRPFRGVRLRPGRGSQMRAGWLSGEK